MKSMKEKVEDLKKYLLKEYPEGEISVRCKSFTDIVGLKGNNDRYIKQLLIDNFITKTSSAKRLSKEWAPAKYKINPLYLNNNNGASGQVKGTSLVESFKGNKITFIPYNDEFVVSQKDIQNALTMSRQAINIIIQRNKQLFDGNRIMDKALGRGTYFTRKGLITLLMKLCTSRIEPEKQKEVIDFQLWAFDVIDTVIAKGFIKLTSDEHEKVKNDLTGILNTDRHEVDKMFDQINDALGNVIYLFNQALVQKDMINSRCDELEKENGLLSSENENLQISKDSFKKAYEQTKFQLIHYRALAGRVANE